MNNRCKICGGMVNTLLECVHCGTVFRSITLGECSIISATGKLSMIRGIPTLILNNNIKHLIQLSFNPPPKFLNKKVQINFDSNQIQEVD